MPGSFNHDNVKSVIQLKSQNTVRITRQHTGANRHAEFNYDSEKIICGSGIFFHSDDLQISHCPLPGCSWSKKPHKAVVNIQIVTGPHVVSEHQEAALSIIDFFFDTQDMTNNIEAQGLKIKKYEKDSPPYCIIECVCHDLSLFSKLNELHNSCQHLMKQIRSRASPSAKEKLLVFIAHPHGLSKHFALGKLKKKEKKNGSTVSLSSDCSVTQCYLKYLSPGCPGSGGGFVMEIGNDGSCLTFALHMGKDNNGERSSGLGWTAE